jgi:hypothetical protein
MITVEINDKNSFEYIRDPKRIGIELLGQDRILHFKHIVGNYWEQRKSGLDTETLFKEMLRLFKKKKLVKQLINDGRDKSIQYIIDEDLKIIFNTFCKKAFRLIARNPDTKEVYNQILCCQNADVVIEEDSACVVSFKGHTYESLVEGRRAILGQLSSQYVTNSIDQNGVLNVFSTLRKLLVYNNFTRKTFWRTTGRLSSISVEDCDAVKNKSMK